MILWSANIWAVFFKAICMHRREVFSCMSSAVATGKSEMKKRSWGFMFCITSVRCPATPLMKASDTAR